MVIQRCAMSLCLALLIAGGAREIRAEALVLREVDNPGVDPEPIVVRTGVVFLSRSEGRPEPRMECRGILMLTAEEVALLSTKEMTLGQALDHGV